MNICYFSLDDASLARGVVIVIDVLRAFTTAAYTLAGGAREIILVGTVEEALQMKKQNPSLLLMGEVGGLPIPGFDFGNSPTQIAAQDLRGKRLVQRTSAGTQGVVRSQGARYLFAGSLVCARATAEAVNRLSPQEVSFVITGSWRDDEGQEDLACANYMAALLRGESPDLQAAIRRVMESEAAQVFIDPNEPDFLLSDLDYAVQIDWFTFAMPILQKDGLFSLEGLPQK